MYGADTKRFTTRSRPRSTPYKHADASLLKCSRCRKVRPSLKFARLGGNATQTRPRFKTCLKCRQALRQHMRVRTKARALDNVATVTTLSVKQQLCGMDSCAAQEIPYRATTAATCSRQNYRCNICLGRLCLEDLTPLLGSSSRQVLTCLRCVRLRENDYDFFESVFMVGHVEA